MNSGRGRRAELLLLTLLFLLALGLRLDRAGTPSLAEDEAAKWLAVQKYRAGRFAGVNSEHPMLMKLLAWGSLDIGQRLDRLAARRGLPHPREETWLRLPDILFGAAATVVLYLLGRQMLGAVGAGFAAFFWAVSPLSVTLNRVLKEETLFTFFTLLAFYFYNRAKLAGSAPEARRNFTFAGIAFGLDLASYYLAIGQFGLIVLIWDVANRARIPSLPMGPHFRRLAATIGLAFILFNPVILSPRNLLAMTHYSEEKTIEHRGYLMDGKLYLNNALTTPYGLPWYFYLWVLGVKTPIPILAAILAGLVLLFCRPRRLISIFLRVTLVFWFLPYSLGGSKWIRYLLLILPSLYLAAGWGIEALWRRLAERGALARAAAIVLAGLVLVAWPMADVAKWAPHERLFLNAFGGGRANVGRYFPPDEVYDLGVREAVEYVCRAAPQGAVLAGSDPMGLRFYVTLLGRPDLRLVPLFDPNYVPRSGDFLLVQDSRRYYETDGVIDLIERHWRPGETVRIDRLVAAQVYRF
jgi:Dolichyl-phosphate-mannose-protein mannosyltransferase/Alg9-like mannosyltransferase family